MQKPVQEHILRVNNYSTPVPLNEAWVKFIERFEPYHWFVTLTFKDDVTNARANKQFARFMRGMNEALYGRRYREKGLGLPYVNARERQKRGTPHFHTLIGGDVWKLRRMTYKELWEGWDGKKFTRNGMARVLPHDRERGARMYVSKYVLKGGEIDVNIPPYMYSLYGLSKDVNQSFNFLESKRLSLIN